MRSIFERSLSVRLLPGFIAFTAVLNVISSVEIQSCCPRGQNLVDSNGINGRMYRIRMFKCVPQSSSVRNLTGYQIATSTRSNIPDCEDVVLVRITDSVTLGQRSCLGVLDGEFYALTCPLASSRLLLEVNLVKKCCPPGFSYNQHEKQCVSSNRTVENFGWLFGQPTILTSDSMECLDNSVVVDYLSGDFNVSFRYGELIVGKSSFDTSSFCLESIALEPIDPKIGNGPITKKDQFLIRTCHTAAICDRIPCVRRCCKFNERLVRRNGTILCEPDPKGLHIVFYEIEPNGSNNFSIADPKVYGILQTQKCVKYPLRPEYNDKDIYYFNYEDGSIYVPSEKLHYKNSDYCVQNTRSEYDDEVETFLCFDSSDKGLLKYKFYSVGLMISSVFLTLTLIVYICVPKLLNIPGKNLICHVISMLAAYIGLFLIQHSSLQFTICYPIAFFIYFSFMATFSWMNVMCFDIWWTFGSSQGTRGLDNFRDNHQFILYSLYAWGVPLVFTTITLSIDYFKLANDIFHPNIGEGRCWFSNTSSPPHLLFFLAPVGILVFTNFVLFVLTLRYCNRVKREIFRMQSTSSEKKSLKSRFITDKARFVMNSKLFIVMGVSWLLEIISTVLYTPEYTAIWYVSDLFNVMQGVVVFFIFVFKRRVWAAIAERLGIRRKGFFRAGATTTVATPTTMLTSTNDLRKMKSMDGLPLTSIRTSNSKQNLRL